MLTCSAMTSEHPHSHGRNALDGVRSWGQESACCLKRGVVRDGGEHVRGLKGPRLVRSRKFPSGVMRYWGTFGFDHTVTWPRGPVEHL